jgi:hypothetical protein
MATIVGLSRRLMFVLVAVSALLCAVPAGQAVPGSHPLQTGIYLSTFGSDTSLAYARTRAAGASVVRIALRWSAVAPATLPASFDAANPADPNYNWAEIDAQVKQAAAHHLQPLLTVYEAPRWAEQGPGDLTTGSVRVQAPMFAAFAAAAATRYDGRHGLPWVRYWQAWNEPNVNLYLGPQFDRGQPAAPALYRQLLNAFAVKVHAAHVGNLVVAGGLSPFTVKSGATVTIGPMRFMRLLLCMSGGTKPKATCSAKSTFDVWSHNPYTSGNATHSATNPDDVSLGDLPEMRTLLDAAAAAGHVTAPAAPRFWVTEWSWDSNPPDPHGVPLALHARWTAEALYQMWKSGVDTAIWLQLRDAPYPASSFQAGLYARGSGGLSTDVAKPALTAFTFPFVAYLKSGGVDVWARTPWGRRQTVVIEQNKGGVWRRIAALRTDGYGIISQSLPGAFVKSDQLRARVPGAQSLPFSLTQPPDRIVDPFGGGG